VTSLSFLVLVNKKNGDEPGKGKKRSEAGHADRELYAEREKSGVSISGDTSHWPLWGIGGGVMGRRGTR